MVTLTLTSLIQEQEREKWCQAFKILLLWLLSIEFYYFLWILLPDLACLDRLTSSHFIILVIIPIFRNFPNFRIILQMVNCKYNIKNLQKSNFSEEETEITLGDNLWKAAKCKRHLEYLNWKTFVLKLGRWAIVTFYR